jgi:hypothetical protein
MGLWKDEHLEECVTWFTKLRGFALCLQETWKLKDTLEDHKGCVLMNTGPDNKLCRRGSLGVGILLSREAKEAWKAAGSQVHCYGLRVIATRLQVQGRKGAVVTIFLVSAYSPIGNAPQAERDDYLANLQRAYNDCGPSEVLVNGMDANASVGRRSRHDDPHQPGRDQVRGPHGLLHENKAGQELCTLLGTNQLCLPSTFFRKKQYGTWHSPFSKRWHQLDHFAVKQSDLRRVRNAGRVGLPGKSSDHFAVRVTVDLRTIKKQVKAEPRIDRSMLHDPKQRECFLDAVKQEMDKPSELNDVAKLEQSLRTAAQATLVSKTKRDKSWYAAAADVLEPLIAARNEANAGHKMQNTGISHERLRSARRDVKRAVRVAEQSWTQKQMDFINDMSMRPVHPADAWKAITKLRQGKSVTKPLVPMSLKRPDGSKAKDPAETADIMTKYLETVFDKDGKFDPTVLELIKQRDPKFFEWMGDEPTDKEIVKAIRKFGNDKSAGDAECPAEYYKAMEHDAETKMYIRDIVAKFWKSGSYQSPASEPEPEPPPAKERPKRNRELSLAGLEAVAYAPLPKAPPALVPEDVPELPPKEADADREGVMYPEWLVARLKLLPKKGDLGQCKNWRGICLLDIASKILSSIAVARMQQVFERIGMESQNGFTSKRGNRDGHFSVSVALQKRKEHNLPTWALFIDLVKAFDTVVRDAVFAVMRKFGLPDHFINILIRLHEGATIKVKIGDIETEVKSTIGVRQGSCEGPSLFLFIIQAALETMDWPVDKPKFCTRTSPNTGEITGAKSNRKGHYVTEFELWSSLFADDCAVLFNTRDDMSTGANYLYHHLRRFGLLMHIGKGATPSKTEAVYYPPPRTNHTDGNQTSFVVADGFVSFTDEFRYLGSIIHHSLTSDADVNARITHARAAFGALQGFLSNKYLNDKCKGTVFSALVVSILLYGSESWCLKEDQLRRLQTFYNSCVRRLCRVTMQQVIKYRISTKQLLQRLEICSIDDYYNSRLLRWTGHVARMKMDRLPRRLLTGWVRHARPVGAPQMTIGRTINKALTKFNITTEFAGNKGWRRIAQERADWRRLTHPNPAVRARKVVQPNARRPARSANHGPGANPVRNRFAGCTCQSWNRFSNLCYCGPGDPVQR